MKKSFLFKVALTIIINLLLLHNSQASIQDDSIRPMVQIDKEFLVVVHIVRNMNGDAGITEAQINTLLSDVNAIFAPITATFTACEFRYIDNFQYDNLIYKADISRKKEELDPLYRLKHRINMYFINDPDIVENKICGYASLHGIGGQGNVVIKKSCADIGTVGHELGHFFGLQHTFQDNTATTTASLAYGEDCKTTGDRFCDTPGDPYFEEDDVNLYVDAGCNFISPKTDQTGNKFAPDVTNIMSYYHCGVLFTLEQYAYMATYYNTHLGTW